MAQPEKGPPIPFSQLPLSKEFPDTKLNAWGLYGDDDEKGFLNRQSDAIVAAAAASEIKTGHRISLNAALDFQTSTHPSAKPLFGRQAFSKNVYQKAPRIVHDDTWTFNTQSSSQWDGLRHFGYQKAQRFYNNTTVAEISGGGGDKGKPADVLGVQNLAARGIVGRAVLVDVERWRTRGPGRDEAGAQAFDAFASTSDMPLDWLLATLAHQGTAVRYGDVLVVRSGFFAHYAALTLPQLDALAAQTPPGLAGLEQSDAALRWIWDNFSAVASDHPSFERWPSPHPWSMHEVLLAGWGCPIGELFQLEELSRWCEQEQRWSFFLVSEPTNVPGGVASPPNVLAIF